MRKSQDFSKQLAPYRKTLLLIHLHEYEGKLHAAEEVLANFTAIRFFCEELKRLKIQVP